MSLDFILIPFCIFIILFLLNRENRIYKRDQKAKWQKKFIIVIKDKMRHPYFSQMLLLKVRDHRINFNLGSL